MLLKIVWENWLARLSWKLKVDTLGGKDVLKQLNWQFGGKIGWPFGGTNAWETFCKKSGAQIRWTFVEIIRLHFFVEKLVNNFVTKFGVQFS